MFFISRSFIPKQSHCRYLVKNEIASSANNTGGLAMTTLRFYLSQRADVLTQDNSGIFLKGCYNFNRFVCHSRGLNRESRVFSFKTRNWIPAQKLVPAILSGEPRG